MCGKLIILNRTWSGPEAVRSVGAKHDGMLARHLKDGREVGLEIASKLSLPTATGRLLCAEKQRVVISFFSLLENEMYFWDGYFVCVYTFCLGDSPL